MLESVRHLEQVAREWNINTEDVLLIALNASGARSSLPKPRMRFRLRLDSRPQTPLFLILSLGRQDSPFELDERELRLNGVKVGEIDGIEDDDAVLGYWRGGPRMLTLNSNARSQCTGCVFCPNTLEDASDPKIKALDLSGYLGALAANSGMDDLSAASYQRSRAWSRQCPVAPAMARRPSQIIDLQHLFAKKCLQRLLGNLDSCP